MDALLVLIQISPLIINDDDRHHGLSAPLLKMHFLQSFSFHDYLISWEGKSSSPLRRGHVGMPDGNFIVNIPSYDPINVHRSIPCWIQVYTLTSFQGNAIKVKVDEGTMVQIIQSTLFHPNNTKDRSSNNINCFIPNDFDDDYNLSISNNFFGKVTRDLIIDKDSLEPQLFRSLTIRMNHLLQNIHYIGTTPHALTNFEQERKQQRQLSHCWKQFFSTFDQHGNHSSFDDNMNPTVDGNGRTMTGSSALTIFNQHENVSIVHQIIRYIAQEKLQCDSVHHIIPSLFFSKYGAQNTNIALECHLHNLVINAATSSSDARVCIILHDLESLASTTSNNPSAYKPTIHAIEAYLSQLVYSLTHSRHFVYPNKHAFYNVGSQNHNGYVFPIRICIVGIFHAVGTKITTNNISILGNNQFQIPATIVKEQLHDDINKVQEINNTKNLFALSFANVGGNTEAKLALEDALAMDPKTRTIFRKMNISLPTGILLYGPPGTGKTMLARAIVSSMGSISGKDKFISLNASQIVQSTIGSSEKLVAHAFERARKLAPSVIFIDEFQALFSNRGSGSSGRLTSTLLQCMDDLCKWKQASLQVNESSMNDRRIVVLAATNTPWMVDSAFLRYGRFDRVVHVGLPNEREREHIFRIHLDRMKFDGSYEDLCQDLAKSCIRFSGADISALCRAAAIQCLHDVRSDSGVSKQHFLEAKQNFTPSNTPQTIEKLRLWKKKQQHNSL